MRVERAVETLLNGAAIVTQQVSTRREWLGNLAKYGKVGLFVGSAITLAGLGAKHALLHTTPREPIAAPPGMDIYPGWVGAEQKVFFDGENGPAEFIRSAVMENRIMRAITHRVLQDFEQAYQQKWRLGLDIIYDRGLDHARDVFAQIDEGRISKNVNQGVEEALAASVSIAFACSGWASASDYRRLGVFRNMFPEETDAQAAFWSGEDSIGRTVLPQIVKDPDRIDKTDEEPSNGEDGTRHFTMFAALYQLVANSMDQETHLEESSPNGLKGAAKFFLHKNGFKSNARRAAFFVEFAGLCYELKSTFGNLPLPGKDRNRIKSGFFDPGVWRDLKINRKGIDFGRKLRFAAAMPKTIIGARNRLMIELEDPDLPHFEDRTLMDGFFQKLIAA